MVLTPTYQHPLGKANLRSYSWLLEMNATQLASDLLLQIEQVLRLIGINMNLLPKMQKRKLGLRF
ncbi:hypothetical protein D9603_14960 [Pseudoalteromonas sp. PS5]|nr:hypothetical protein D9603_14960 [Pseudoalteromonas sp. PS5]